MIASTICHSWFHCVARALAIAALGCVLLSGRVSAATLPGLYQATVPSPGGDEAARNAAFQQAMRIVVVRVTGRRDAANAAGLAALIDQAGRYVQVLKPVARGQLEVGFDGGAIENAIAAAGMPYWGAERPTLLVWLAVDRGNGQRGIVTAATQSDERRAVEQVAEQRGVPIAWPSLAASDNPLRRFEQVMSGSTGGLIAEATRLGYDGVLIGRSLAKPGAPPAVNWSFQAAGASDQASGGLADGPNLAADRLAAVFASVSAAQRSDLRVVVSGVTSLDAYAAALKALGAADIVRSVDVVEVDGDRLTCRVAVRGDAPAYRRALAPRRDLVPVAGAEGGLDFQYRP
jgi:hypothetical protein